MSSKTSVYKQNHHNGNMPIRVLQHTLTNAFDNIYPEFRNDLEKLFRGRSPERGILWNDERLPIFSLNQVRAAALTKENNIVLYEPFLSYLWAFSFAFYIYFQELVLTPADYRSYSKINLDDLHRTPAIMEYGYSLRTEYSVWDKELLPNPEAFTTDEAHLVGKTNGVFTNAVLFTIAHEFAHSYYQDHITQFNMPSIEYRADNLAIDLTTRQSLPEETLFNRRVGILTAVSAFVLLSAHTNSLTHPDSIERIENALTYMNLKGNDSLWAIPCIAIRIWDHIYQIGLEWGGQEGTYKDLFFRIKDQ